MAEGTSAVPKVYFAHASEDKALARPIAQYLRAKGVDTWFDEWEIEAGDSLRQKMEEGLGEMTHLAVLLTPTSITKPWVSREIDVGMVRLVGGQSRMMPIMVGVDISDLSPFLQTLLCVRLDPTSDADLDDLVGRLHGANRRPPLGPAPPYLRCEASGPAGWSAAATAIARYLVETSKDAMIRDPVRTVAELAVATGLDETAVRLAALELKDSGMLWESGSIRGHYAPEGAMFAEFDSHFMPFEPAADGRVLANRLVASGERGVLMRDIAAELEWEPRRINSATAYLEQVGAIDMRKALSSSPWRAAHLIVSDRTLRYVREKD